MQAIQIEGPVGVPLWQEDAQEAQLKANKNVPWTFDNTP